MPKGFSRASHPDLYNQAPQMPKVTYVADDAPRHGGSALGALDRLTRRSEVEYKALLVVTAMLERDAGERASAALPVKLLAAYNQRALVTANPVPVTTKAHGTIAAAQRETGKTHINKERLTLFVLEQLTLDGYTTYRKMYDMLLKAGNPPMKHGARSVSAVVGGSLQRRGYVKIGPEGGYRLSAAGAKHAKRSRAALEAANLVAKGGYFVPTDVTRASA